MVASERAVGGSCFSRTCVALICSRNVSEDLSEVQRKGVVTEY